MKITYNYGTMNSGKSMTILSMYHNYVLAGKRPILIKPDNASRDGENKIISRVGLEAKCITLPIALVTDLKSQFYICVMRAKETKSPIIIDEGQFFTTQAVNYMCYLAVLQNVELLVFGLLTDFKGKMFFGSKAWLENATHIRETKTICSICGKYKANHNMMIDKHNHPIFELEGSVYPKAKYIAVCERCYLNNLRKN